MTEPAPAYRATHVVDSTKYVPTQGTIRMKQVYFTTADGHQTYVEVPLDQFTPDVVEEMIQDYVSKHQAVMAIQGPAV